jgi:hypothetical protein
VIFFNCFTAENRLAKYSAVNRFKLQKLTDPVAALNLKPGEAKGKIADVYRGIVNESVSKATWEKYSSGCKAFACFEASQCTSYDWPLSQATCRHFAIWCSTVKKLQPSSIKTYLSALKFAHGIRGLSSKHLDEDPIMTMILKGITHHSLSNPSSPTRRVVTFSLLRTIGDRIARTDWDPLSKQVIWAASTVAFFGSTRLGEILASEDQAFSLSSDLTWNDVRVTSSGSFLLRIKQPKSGEKEGEYVDIFPFKGYNCCPVKALLRLRDLQKAEGVFDPSKPVFRFASGAYLTTTRFNKVLAELLRDVCIPGMDTISCHSFRAGIPSILSLFPELATSDMIKGWGRWQSDCYMRYTRLQLPQREKIFATIADALRTAG